MDAWVVPEAHHVLVCKVCPKRKQYSRLRFARTTCMRSQ